MDTEKSLIDTFERRQDITLYDDKHSIACALRLISYAIFYSTRLVLAYLKSTRKTN